MNTLDICEHKYVTEIDTKIKGYEHPIVCDDCHEIIECRHEYEYTDNNEPYCWVCGFEPDLADWVEEEDGL